MGPTVITDMSDATKARLAVGRMIRDARWYRGLTQAQLAKRLKTTQSYVSVLEAGKRNLTVSNLVKVGLALGHDLKIEFE